MMRTFTKEWVGLGIAALALTACGSDDPLGGGSEEDGSAAEGTLVVGSQQYYSNTIVAELYAQVLEDAGYDVEREFEIGQREVYMPELEAGEIDVFPEYTGNLLQYLDGDSEASTSEEVEAELETALPEGLTVLAPAEATDQDSYTVTAEFAEENGLESIADLAELEDLTIVSNSEFETRPYGPQGASEVYGAEISLLAVEDSGGQLTLNALLDGEAEIANIYTADPAIEENDLVVLEDPEELILPQNLFPLVSSAVDEEAQAALEEVSAALTQEELIALNTRSVDEQVSAEDVAETWLVQHQLIEPDGSGEEG